MRTIARFLLDDNAATAVEYAVMLAMLLLVALAAIGVLGTRTSGVWNSVVSTIGGFGM